MSILMGILNMTPDSFSGDGLWQGDHLARAMVQAEQMIADGAQILDVGGESSRPGATAIGSDEEKRRVIPIIVALRQAFPQIEIAVDTTKPEVAAEAVTAGASILNDVSALTVPEMAALASKRQVRIVIMHNTAKTDDIRRDAVMGNAYAEQSGSIDIVEAVRNVLTARVAEMVASGVDRDQIILDPGIGFGKSVAQNLKLVAQIERLKELDLPLLVGLSRKNFIGQVLGLPPTDRLEGTAACVTACALKGVDILRVHDVKTMSRTITMAKALRDA